MTQVKKRSWKSLIMCCGLVIAGPVFMSGCAVSGYEHLPDDQQDAVRRMQDYWDSIVSFKADFVQEGLNQKEADGHFLYTPKGLKMDYTTPAGMTLVARNGYVTINDPSTGAVTKLSLKKNPLGFLLQHPLRLSDGVQVTHVVKGKASLQVSLAEADNPSQGLLTLQFSDVHGRLSLVGLEGVDARHHHISLSLFNSKEETSEPNEAASPSSSSQ